MFVDNSEFFQSKNAEHQMEILETKIKIHCNKILDYRI